MKKSSLLTPLLTLSISMLMVSPAVQAQRSATPTSVRIGYFNLSLVKASYPEAAGFEELKNQAEGQLRRDLDDANRQIQAMKDAKKSADEIQRAVHESQVSIDAKQQALAQLLQTQNNIAREKIQRAVMAVAKDKSLDLVVDGEGLFSGGKLVIDNGIDITEAVVKKLQPQAISAK